MVQAHVHIILPVFIFHCSHVLHSVIMEHYVELLPTVRGGSLLNLDGFHFRYTKKVQAKSYWQCKTLGCHSSAILLNNKFFSVKGKLKINFCKSYNHINSARKK